MSLIKRTLILPFKIPRMRDARTRPLNPQSITALTTTTGWLGSTWLEHASMSLPTTSRSLSDSDCPRCGEHQPRETLPSRRAKCTKTASPRECYIDPYQPSIETFMRTTTGNSQTCYSNLTKASLYCYNLWHLYFVMYIRERSNILAAPPPFLSAFYYISPIIKYLAE